MSSVSDTVEDHEWPAPYGRVILDEVDSTNSYALQQAVAENAPTWYLAHRQTAARGRRGHPWVTPQGNLNASLLIDPQRPPAEAAQLSFVAALALARSLAHFSDAYTQIALKWPNDVLLNGGKVAGILLESAPKGRVVIGIGVNLLAAPKPAQVLPHAVSPVALAAEIGKRVPPERFLDQLAKDFDHWFKIWQDEGFASIRSAWTAKAARLGETITARITEARHVTGRMEGIDETGALILTTARGREVIQAGDIFFDASESG